MRQPLVRKRTVKPVVVVKAGRAFVPIWSDKSWKTLAGIVYEQAQRAMEIKEDCAALCREPEEADISDASLGLLVAEDTPVKETTYTIVDNNGVYQAVENAADVQGTVVGTIEVTATEAILRTKQISKASAMFSCAYMETAGKERRLVFSAQ